MICIDSYVPSHMHILRTYAYLYTNDMFFFLVLILHLLKVSRNNILWMMVSSSFHIDDLNQR